MKLIYRGVSYDYNPPVVEAATSSAVGKYRGLDWRFRNLEKPPILQPRANLTYRGVTYNRSNTVAPQQTTSAISTQDKARTLMMQQTKTTRKRQQSLLSRVASEIGLGAEAVMS